MFNVKKVIAALVVSSTLTGCAINAADEDGISIRHAADNDFAVQARANSHCGSFGKTAVRVQRESIGSFFGFRSVTTSFRCVVREDRN